MHNTDEDVATLAELAREQSLRIAVAESLTSGAVASTVGAGAGASVWFAGAVVAYQQDVKERVLNVPAGTDPCSAECAEQLATGVRELLVADVAVATTGVGGPEPDDGHPAGTVFLGWATAAASGSRFFTVDGDPAHVLVRTTAEAVRLLVELVSADGHVRERGGPQSS